MKTKRLSIAITILGLVLGPILLSNNVFARGSNGGDNGSNYETCDITSNGNYRACFGENGGVSWRYYTTDQPVTFRAHKGTGGDVTINECTEVGGFWFHGFESFSIKNGKKIFDGFQVPKVTNQQGKDTHYVTSSEAIKYSKTHVINGETRGGINGGRLGSLAEVKAAYAAASKDMREKENASPEDWPVSLDDANIYYFCYSPETAAYAAQSKVAIANTSSQTTWSSTKNTGNTLRKTIIEGESVDITFTHYLRQDGTGTLSGTTYSVSGAGAAESGKSFNGKDATLVYQDTITVTDKNTYCSTITYDNKASQGSDDTVTSTICAEIDTTPKKPDEKTAIVTFSASSEVRANGDFEVINESTGEKEDIHSGDLLGTGSSDSLDNIKNLANTNGITVVDEWIPLKFSHTVIRTDSSTNVSKAYTHTILTPPSASLTLNNVGVALRNTLFKSKNLLDRLKDIFDGKAKLSDLFKKGTETAESGKLIQKALEGAVESIPTKNSDYFKNALKLRTEDLEIGGTDSGYTTTGEYKATGGTGQDYCQMLIYQNSRTVYADDNESATLTGIPFLDKMLNLVVDGGKLTINLVQSLINGGEIDSATFESFRTSLSDFGKVSMEYFSSFLQQVINGNMPVSGACVRLKKAFDFNINPEPIIVDTPVAIIGESISLNPDSTITSTPLHSDMVTDTSELEVRVINFWVNNNQANSLMGNFTQDSAARGNQDPCTYYASNNGANDCNEIKTVQGIVISREDSKDNYQSVVKKLNELGITDDLRATVPDLEVGSLFCFAIGVKDSDSDSYNEHGPFSTGGRWAISNASCRTVAKKPSMQVWGGSAYSAKEIKTSITNKNNVFGSWVEYGAIAKGKISGFASGNALNIDPRTDDFSNTGNSPLTITNEDKDNLGNSGIDSNEKLLNRIYEVYRDQAKSRSVTTDYGLSCATGQTCYFHYDTNATISGTDINGTVVVYAEDNITIGNNITYSDGPFGDINDIPQVIIISDKDIKINSNVSRVDAWLIAGGKLDTCGDKSSNFGSIGTDYDAVACNTDSTSLDGTYLVINGPIITSNQNTSGANKNYRTGGSGVGNNSSIPAEVFNLPASTYLWAYNQGIKSGKGFYEVYQQELAPRL